MRRPPANQSAGFWNAVISSLEMLLVPHRAYHMPLSPSAPFLALLRPLRPEHESVARMDDRWEILSPLLAESAGRS